MAVHMAVHASQLMLPRLESRLECIGGLRYALYAFVVTWTTARTTYALTYLQPDRPFTSGHTWFVVFIGFFMFACMCACEIVRGAPAPFKYGVWTFCATMVVFVHVAIDGWLNPSTSPTCHQSFAFVVLGMPGMDINVVNVQKAFGDEVRVWKGVDHTEFVDVKNMTESRGIETGFLEAHKHLVARVMSVYDALESYETDKNDWIVMFEDTAKPLPQFHAKLEAFACKHVDKDVLWLHGPAAVRWSVTGIVDDGCVGMAYRRSSIEHVLRWLDLDGQGVLRGKKKHGEESEEVVSINNLISDACWMGELKCAAAPLVVESKMREHG